MDKATSLLGSMVGIKGLKSVFGLRFLMFNFIIKNLLGLKLSLNPFTPGLETKYALEAAKHVGAKVVYLDCEFDKDTIGRINHEKRPTLLRYLKNYYFLNSHYKREFSEFANIVSVKGWRAFVESSMDSKQLNWIISFISILFPEYRRILVDRKDEDLFTRIIAQKGKKMVAVVNQHHIEGLEHHWCVAYGTTPTYNNDFALETINPIGDMPLRRMLYDQMYHVIKRDIKSSRMRSSPASLTNEINIYHREFNHQYEHRNM